MTVGTFVAHLPRSDLGQTPGSTFYACPSPHKVNNWALKTPDEFIFSVKVPQVITHKKVLVDGDAEFEEFVDTMGWLGEKLGPMVLQFPFFEGAVFRTQNGFSRSTHPVPQEAPARLQVRSGDSE